MAAGVFLFSAVDTCAKFLTDSLHPIQIAWSRQAGLCLGILVLLAWRGWGLLRTKRRGLQMARGALAAFSTALFIMAVTYVPLADAVAVSFVVPFLVTVLGALVLREKVGLRRWTAVVIGFLGMLIVIRPGMGVVHPAAGLVVVAASCYAMRQILSRRLGAHDPTMTTVAYTGLTASALLTLPLPFVWRTPDLGQLGLLVVVAVLAAAAEVLVIRALELAQAVVLAPLHYTLIIWGTFYGWLVFGELPDLWTWLGAGIIVVSGLYMVHRETVVARRASADPGAAT